MYKTIAGLLLALVLGVAGYGWYVERNGKSSGELEQRQVAQALPYTMESYRSEAFVSGSASCTGTAQVPYFGVPALDRLVLGMMAEALAYTDESQLSGGEEPFTVQAALDAWRGACETSLRDVIAKTGATAGGEYSFSVVAEMPTATVDVLSMVFRVSSYMGGAHPNSWTVTRTMNPMTGERLDLVTSSMMRPLAETLLREIGDVLFDESKQELSSFLANERAESAVRVKQWFAGTWFVRGNEVVIVFDPYRHTPYAAGRLEVSIDRTTNAAELRTVSGYPIREEMVSAFNNKARGFVVVPDVEGEFPGVIMVHEWWGLKNEIKESARELARQGYMVFAIDLYGGKVAQTAAEAAEYKGQVVQTEATESMRLAKQYLKEHGAKKIASMGWCFGGGQAMQLAISGEPLDATVVYYGTPMITDAAVLKQVKWPVLGVFGDKDTAIPLATIDAFRAALKTANVTHEVYVYPGLGHAFANPSNANHAPAETKDAWAKTVLFLETHLRGK